MFFTGLELESKKFKEVALRKMIQKEKNGKVQLSEGDYDLNLHSLDNLLTFTENVNNIYSEIQALQRSIAIMKHDLPKILRDELIRLKG